MAELRMKYVCRSAVALVDTNCFGVPFSFLFRFLVAQGNLVPLVTTGKCWNIHNSSRITPEIQPSPGGATDKQTMGGGEVKTKPTERYRVKIQQEGVMPTSI